MVVITKVNSLVWGAMVASTLLFLESCSDKRATTEAAADDSDSTCSSSPGGTITALSAGGDNTCAVVDGAVMCWGKNDYGQLGNGTTTASGTPVAVSGLSSGATQVGVAAGSAVSLKTSACALVNGAIKCWGANDNGQLGNSTTTNSSVPVDTGSLSSVVSLSVGALHSCAVAGSQTYCWGLNAVYELGNGDGSGLSSGVHSSPTATGSGLAGGAVPIATSAGVNHSCVVTDGYGVECWGSNDGGRLGGGTDADPVDSGHPANPVQVSALGGYAKAIAGSWAHTCAIVAAGIGDSSGQVKCWGYNTRGQLGDASTTDRNSAIAVSGLSSDVSAVAAGFYHSCAIVSGAVKCWGANDLGQLGNNSTTDSATPVSVSGLDSGATAIATGDYHSCAVVSNTVWCWGNNAAGELGIGNSSVPVQVQWCN